MKEAYYTVGGSAKYRGVAASLGVAVAKERNFELRRVL
jgi:hypothetical protein